MPVDEDYKRRAMFVYGLSRIRYGDRILRGLACEALDLSRIASLTDRELEDIPGMGTIATRQVRELLKECGMGE